MRTSKTTYCLACIMFLVGCGGGGGGGSSTSNTSSTATPSVNTVALGAEASSSSNPVNEVPTVTEVPVDSNTYHGVNVYHGVNLAGAEFTSHVLPGVVWKDYVWPTASVINQYSSMGVNVIRIPFLWERMQPALNKPLDSGELKRLDTAIAAASAKKITVVLDVHNYGYYRGKLLGSQEVPVEAFKDLWKRLSEHVISNPYIAFGLMNEPNQHKADEWAAIAQAGIDAIRNTGANHLILVPGTLWSGAHSWLNKVGNFSNAEALRSIQDPLNNMAFEVHQFLDSDSSGTHDTCVSDDIGVKRLTAITDWLRRTGHRAFLGEFGAAKNTVCLNALEQILKYMQKNNDVWYGWTYWGASEWFGNYRFNIYPPDSTKYPQVSILKNAMSGY